MQLAPEPRMHTTHRRPHNKARMADTEPFGEQTVIRLNHVEISVAREFCMHAVARLARFAMTDAVRQHDEKFHRIEWLIFTEQFAGKFGANKLRAAAGGP